MALTGFIDKIQWNQFREISKQPGNVSEDAEIFVIYNLKYQTQAATSKECKISAVSVDLKMNKSKSWVVKNKKSSELLRHEQGHYDITALGAREVYQRISALTVTQCAQIETQLKQIQKDVQKLINQVNIRYDKQTSHGVNSTIQKNWEASIRTAKKRADGTLAGLPH